MIRQGESTDQYRDRLARVAGYRTYAFAHDTVRQNIDLYIEEELNHESKLDMG